MTVLHRVQFGADGDADAYFAEGFHPGEDGFAWTMGELSSVEFPPPDRTMVCAIRVEGQAYAPSTRLPAQTLRVKINGRWIGEARLSQPFDIEWATPGELTPDTPVKVVFEHPNAARPCDFSASGDGRRIALALQRIELISRADETASPSVDISNRDLAIAFVSLGGDCEFGFVQRALGAEPLGLFRFGGIAAGDLATLLRLRFEGLGSMDALTVHEENNQIWVQDERYRFGSHVWGEWDGQSREDLRASESRRIALLAQKMLRDLSEGEKIFVFKSRGAADEAERESLFDALQDYGNTPLLWVNHAAEAATSGAVERIHPNLFQANVAEPTGPLEQTTNLSDWRAICRAALELRAAMRAGG